MKYIWSIILGISLLCSHAHAWTHGVAGPTGGAQVNIGSDSIGGLLNALNGASSISFGGGATPAQLDANGYPAATLTSGQTVGFGFTVLDSYQGSTPWVFKWTPAGDAVVFFGSGGWTTSSVTGCSHTGGGSTLITMTAGTPCRIVFTWNVLAGGSLSGEFRAAAYAPGSPPMVLARLSDEAAIDNGEYFTPELVSRWSSTSLRSTRTMPWSHSIDANRSTQSLWAYRTTPSSFAWFGGRFPPGTWAGASSGTNQYTTAQLPSDSGSSGWVDGEVITTTIANTASSGTVGISSAVTNSGTIRLTLSSTATFTTNQQVYVTGTNGCPEANGIQTLTVVNATTLDYQGTTTCSTSGTGGNIGVLTLTVTGKTGGTKFIGNDSGNASGTDIVAGMATFTYDALLDIVKWRGNNAGTGITGMAPIEVQVALANKLNVNLWTTLPTYADSTYAYATSEAALICSLLNPWLNWYGEYTNESWNFGFPQFAYMANQGARLSISHQSMYGLRVRQMMEAIGTQWASSGCSSSRLVRTIAWQAFGDGLVTSHRLNGSELNASTNTRLAAKFPGINYTTAGQRPVDWADTGSYATYFSGTAMTNGFDVARYTIDPISINILQTLADAFAIDPNDTTALDLLDKNFRQGTVKTQAVGSVAGTTVTMPEAINASDAGGSINAGGSGYTNGTQILSVLGGTCTIAPKISVTVSGNAVTSAGQIVNRGRCSVFPTMPASTSGGGGTGATVTISSTAMYVNGQPGIFTVSSGGSVYTGVTANVPVWIVSVSGNTFGVSATYNGSAIPLSGGSGTISFGILVNQTLLDLSRLIYQNVGGNSSAGNPGWEQVAASYDVYRAGVGRSILWIENYEGGLEANAPTAAQCTSMGVLVGGSAVACSSALTAGLNAYKNSVTYGQAIARDQFNQMMGRDAAQPLTFGLQTHSKTPSWFNMAGNRSGPSQWSLLPGGINTTPFKTWDAVAAFH